MNQNTKLLPAILIVGGFALAFAVIGYFIGTEPSGYGSVQRANEYHATTTELMTAGEKHLINTDGTTLGSVIVASTSPQQVTIYNATSTSAYSISVADKIVTLDNTIGSGTYTFDIYLPDGLVIDIPAGYDGSYTITWR
jgi:hypothetical protein